MTFRMALRRLQTNVRLFPTLALITAIVGIVEFSQDTLFLTVCSRSALLGVIGATGIMVCGIGGLLTIFLAIANKPHLFHRMEILADNLYLYVNGNPETSNPETDTEPQEDEDAAPQEDEAEEEEPTHGEENFQ